MNNLHIKYIVLIVIVLFFSMCNRQKKKSPDENYSIYNENLIKANKYLVKEDIERIEKYIKRRNWDMKKTKTGLWYMIYKKGHGEFAAKGKVVSMNFKVELLDGTICYTSDSVGVKKFKIGYGDVEPGLAEGMLMLREGDKARFIIPPNMAHGLIGDQNRIPARSIIVYELEVLNISNN